ncbi:hypothetical protein QRX50_21875 [Amycolatopsis carbonis]|uniref:Uncharacterized protein n=1 Tax=Amycolatopsis carbonis TaxID=715471 RepID=A0A9Y2ISI0_9PSEU|nr:hypothetical protein [Amycolatopsis sp. 2-15]WIX83988.1 hypothetical protein QRX50_21875 [Amycolatopsis sp. 2-15]
MFALIKAEVVPSVLVGRHRRVPANEPTAYVERLIAEAGGFAGMDGRAVAEPLGGERGSPFRAGKHADRVSGCGLQGPDPRTWGAPAPQAGA